MDRSQKSKLLREAAEYPARLLTLRKFWRLDLWPYYLRRCNDLLFDEPRRGLAFAERAPGLATKISAANPGANGADLMLLAYSCLGSAYRAVGDYASANNAFEEAEAYRASATLEALAEHLRRLAYLRLFEKNPECFQIIGEAIAIHKRGSLVRRHGLGECLLCRGHAYHEFKQARKSFEDLSASLNHLSLKVDDRPWYSALHNLAVWAGDYGTEAQLETALANLKPALLLLSSYSGRRFARLKLRWLIAVLDARLGHHGSAKLALLEVRSGLIGMKLVYEAGMVQVDLAMLYLTEGKHAKLERLAHETVAIFRRLGVEARAQEALGVWRQADVMTVDLLTYVRCMFAKEAKPIPALAAKAG